MFNIADYLKRAAGLIDKNSFSKSEIIGVINKHTTIVLKPEEFEVKEGILKINLSPLQRNVITLKKEVILRDLKDFGIINMR